MLKYIFPRLAWRDMPLILGLAVLGALVAGTYGIVHDEVTYSISPEYFTRLKFHQFGYANFGLGDRVFAGTIGFLATWWVGFIAAWLLARRLTPNQPRGRAIRRVLAGFASVFLCGFTFGLAGFAYGLWRGPEADYTGWQWAIRELGVTQLWPFVRVAYIHNAGYFGGLIGLIAALVAIRPEKPNEERNKLSGPS